MQEITLVDFKKRLKSFADDIYTIPDHFIIHNDYIKNISKQDFINAFKEYRNIIGDMYYNAALKPIEYGFTSIKRSNGEEQLYDEFKSVLTYRAKLAQPHHLINRICESSIFLEDTLEVDVSKLNQKLKILPKIKNPDLLIQRLIEHGFVFYGYNGKLKKTDVLKISHSKNKYIINVMNSYSQSKYSKLGMEYDYAHFNFRLLTIGTNENLPLNHLYVFNSLSNTTRDFLINFNNSMNKEGYYYGKCPTSGFCWGISQFAYSKSPEKKKDYVCRLYQRSDTLVVRLFLKNINTYSNYIEVAPEFIKESFINDFGKCTFCKDNCKSRKTYTINDKEYNKCAGITFEFSNLELSSIPYYLQLLNYSINSKKI